MDPFCRRRRRRCHDVRPGMFDGKAFPLERGFPVGSLFLIILKTSGTKGPETLRYRPKFAWVRLLPGRDLAFSTSFLLDNESSSHLPATSQHWLRMCDHLQSPTPSAENDSAFAQERDDDSARPLPLSPLRPLALLHDSLGGSPGISPRGRERDITWWSSWCHPREQGKGWTCLQVQEVK